MQAGRSSPSDEQPGPVVGYRLRPWFTLRFFTTCVLPPWVPEVLPCCDPLCTVPPPAAFFMPARYCLFCANFHLLSVDGGTTGSDPP